MNSSWDILLQILAFLLQFYRNSTAFEHKRRFSQVHKHKNQIKTVLHTNFKYDTFEMQKKMPVMTRKKMGLPFNQWYFFKKYHWLNGRPLLWMFKVSDANVDASTQTLAKADFLTASCGSSSRIFSNAAFSSEMFFGCCSDICTSPASTRNMVVKRI